ncbi:MAG: hypothetical protein OH337_04145 [Candidatus Parvarchaeota archaeon]|nr:hypothetical protein [Candidatus Haiyanarchaeum thermophilum]
MVKDKIVTLRVEEDFWRAWKDYCKRIGVKPTSAIRHLMVEAMEGRINVGGHR